MDKIEMLKRIASSNPLTYIFFLPSLILPALLAVIIVKMRSI
jgi:hypothetical protein